MFTVLLTTSVPYADIAGVRIEEQQRSTWDAPICVADGLGHHRDAAAWLAARIESTARSARHSELRDRGPDED